jgi:hypothetical protein
VLIQDRTNVTIEIDCGRTTGLVRRSMHRSDVDSATYNSEGANDGISNAQRCKRMDMELPRTTLVRPDERRG